MAERQNGFGACRAELQDAIAQSVGSKPDGRLKGHKRRRMVRAQFSLQLRLADHRFVFLTLGALWQAQAAEDTEGAEKAEEEEEDDDEDEDGKFEVEEITQRRVRGGVVEYLVLWQGYPLSAATWEPEANLGGFEEELAAFDDGDDEATADGQGYAREPPPPPPAPPLAQGPAVYAFADDVWAAGTAAPRMR